MNNLTIAVIGKINKLDPIYGAENILSAEVVCGKAGKWRGIVKKNEFKLDDLCEVFLPDCILPQHNDKFSFMEKHDYRVKMIRLRGAPSEVLIMPIKNLDSNKFEIGYDITGIYGCTKYFKPMPANMDGIYLAHFPSFIPKTDQPNFQASPHLVEALIGQPYYITEKADGCSATIYKYHDHFGCCSRNLELKEDEKNSIWEIAKKFKLRKKLPEGFALQLEIVGEKIQKNPMGLRGIEPRLFDIYNINEHRYLSFEEIYDFNQTININKVKLIDSGDSFSNASCDDLINLAEGQYANGKQREGIVVRSKDENRICGDRLSFKVINLQYENR